MFAHWIGVSWIVWSLVASGVPVPCASTAPAAVSVPTRAERIGPCIVAFDPDLVPTLELLWQRSPTYRRQCQFLASRRAIVSLKLEMKIAHGHRASSSIGRLEDGRIVVMSRIGAKGPLAELVAHELEHALEFAEGVKYQMEVLRGTASVAAGGPYETRRADQAGRRAADEVRRAHRPPPTVIASTANRAIAQCGT